MAHAFAASKTFFLKTKISCYCWECEKKLKNFLHKIHGVQSVSFDPKEEKLTITGTVFPEKIIKELRKNHITAELFVEQTPKPNKPEKDNKQIVLSQPRPDTGKEIQVHGHNLGKDLGHLSSLKGMKHVEITYSTTVVYTFDGKRKDNESDVRKMILIKHEAEDDDYEQPQKIVDKSGSSKFHGAGSSGSNGKWVQQEQAPPWQPPHPVYNDYQPSAPPWQTVYGHPYSYSGEHPNSCTIL